MILVGAVVPVIASVLLSLVARWAGRRIPPRNAVPIFAGAAAVVATTMGFVLAVIAITVAGTDTEVAALGHWSAAVVARLAQIPAPIGVAAGGVLLFLVLSTGRRAAQRARALWHANAECRRIGEGLDGLVVIDDERPEAYALPGVQGRVVVSRGMLAALTPAERRVLFAHERSHLAHRHALYVQLTELAVAANPLLRPVGRIVRESVERWADEDAARAVGDRQLAARSLARAAAAASAGSRVRSGAALAMTGCSVTSRARALLAPAPRPRRLLAAAVLGCAVFAGVGAVVVEHTAEHTFERAGRAAVQVHEPSVAPAPAHGTD